MCWSFRKWFLWSNHVTGVNNLFSYFSKCFPVGWRGVILWFYVMLQNAPKIFKCTYQNDIPWHPMTSRSLHLNNICVSCQLTGTLEFSESMYIHLVFLRSRLSSLNKPKVLSLRNTHTHTHTHNCKDEVMCPINDNHDGQNPWSLTTQRIP